MLPIGFVTTLAMAFGEEAVTCPSARARFSRMLFGVLYEDVLLVPGTELGCPAPSVTHFWPFALPHFELLYRRAVRAARAGDEGRADLLLGRAVHVLVDMACPPHAQGVVHGMTDPYERWVDAHARELYAEPVPELPPEVARGGSLALIRSMIRAGQEEFADGTLSLWGRALHRLGLRRKPRREELEGAAFRLVPLAAAHVRRLFELFEEDVAESRARAA